MKRHVIVALAVVTSVVAMAGGTAQAHQLESDHGITAVLHIQPDDDPYAGRNTFMDFDFTSQRPGFDLRYCECRVSIQTSPDRLQTVELYSSSDSPTRGHAVVNFPSAGVYDAQVRGIRDLSTPTDRFLLAYRLRVAAASSSSGASAKSLQVIMLSLTSLVLLGFGAASAIGRGGRYSKKRGETRK